VNRDPGMTLSEKLGASAGAWAVLWLTLHYVILANANSSVASLESSAYVDAVLRHRMAWESATALRVMGGIMIIWFMGSLGSRLRMAEGEPGRLSSIAFGIGVVWGAIWLLSAMMNSFSIFVATQLQNAGGSQLAGVLANEMVLILTPSLVFALTLATSFVGLRFGGFPTAYTYATTAFSVLIFILAVVDWYGPGNLGFLILTLSFAWTATTSLLLVPGWLPPDLVRGTR
jgi:hypothetical protein